MPGEWAVDPGGAAGVGRRLGCWAVGEVQDWEEGGLAAVDRTWVRVTQGMSQALLVCL